MAEVKKYTQADMDDVIKHSKKYSDKDMADMSHRVRIDTENQLLKRILEQTLKIEIETKLSYGGEV